MTGINGSKVIYTFVGQAYLRVMVDWFLMKHYLYLIHIQEMYQIIALNITISL